MKRIVTRKRLRLYGQKYPRLRSALDRWETVVTHADWKGPADVRRSFGDADPVRVASGNAVWVFNVKSHRLVAAIHFNTGVVYVLRLMSHAEYDSGRWKEQL